MCAHGFRLHTHTHTHRILLALGRLCSCLGNVRVDGPPRSHSEHPRRLKRSWVKRKEAEDRSKVWERGLEAEGVCWAWLAAGPSGTAGAPGRRGRPAAEAPCRAAVQVTRRRCPRCRCRDPPAPSENSARCQPRVFTAPAEQPEVGSSHSVLGPRLATGTWTQRVLQGFGFVCWDAHK